MDVIVRQNAKIKKVNWAKENSQLGHDTFLIVSHDFMIWLMTLIENRFSISEKIKRPCPQPVFRPKNLLFVEYKKLGLDIFLYSEVPEKDPPPLLDPE